MDPMRIREALGQVASGALSPDAAFEQLRVLPFEDLGFAKVDHHRAMRLGFAETIFGEGKTPAQIVEISLRMDAAGSTVLGTRCSPEALEAVHQALPQAEIDPSARAFVIRAPEKPRFPGFVAIAAAGTTDLPVAEEAAITCRAYGLATERFYDIGVAALQRLLVQIPRLREASAIVVCAGMEGALPGVTAALVDVPVIGVPTSVGYGAQFSGLAPLLTMLNSCAAGLSVVNIDNGFGAASAAFLMVQSAHRLRKE